MIASVGGEVSAVMSRPPLLLHGRRDAVALAGNHVILVVRSGHLRSVRLRG